MLKLLQPVESSWKTLARFLLTEKLQSKLDTIQSDCFHDDANKTAFDDLFSLWFQRATGPKRTWGALCSTAKKQGDTGDNSLEQYMKANTDIKCEF